VTWKRDRETDVSRKFLVLGVVYLLVGVVFGMYMGGSGDHTLAPVHAQINLLGLTLMTVFGLVYRMVPAMAANGFATAHFWLHQIGAAVLLNGLYLLMTGTVAESVVGPVMPFAVGAVLLGVLAFAWNLLRNGASGANVQD
jgi:hypothetical protein